MARALNITDEEQAEARRKIRNLFAFTQDVLDDPSILDQMPDESYIEAIQKAERDPNHRYDIETPNMVATVTPTHETEHRKPA